MGVDSKRQRAKQRQSFLGMGAAVMACAVTLGALWGRSPFLALANEPAEPPAAENQNEPPKEQGDDDDKPKAKPRFKKIKVDGLSNTFQLNRKLACGSAPSTDEDFAALAKLGIKTIISVDKAPPNVELAKRHGIRYIHAPIGYGKVERKSALTMMRAVELAKEPVYMHCHQGKHRGPAAAAIVCRGIEGWTSGDAAQLLKEAKTDPAYADLVGSVIDFTSPTSEELEAIPNDFPEVVPASEMALVMVEVHKAHSRLNRWTEEGFAFSKEEARRKDLSVAALELHELFHELTRSEIEALDDPGFLDPLNEADAATHDLLELLKAESATDDFAARGEKIWTRLNQSCQKCHESYR